MSTDVVTLVCIKGFAMVKKPASLGRVEWELLQYIDQNHPISVREVAQYWIEKTGQARTTVLTMMERMTKKGFLTRKKIDNVFHYSPKLPLSEVLKNLVGDFVNGVLGGSVVPLAAYLTQSQPPKAQEIEQLKKLVQRLEADTSALARKRGKSK
jgi:predicted transcriptional regulator